MQGAQLREQDEVHSQSFYKEASTQAALDKISSTIVCYRGNVKNPKWMDAEPGQPLLLPRVAKADLQLGILLTTLQSSFRRSAPYSLTPLKSRKRGNSVTEVPSTRLISRSFFFVVRQSLEHRSAGMKM